MAPVTTDPDEIFRKFNLLKKNILDGFRLLWKDAEAGKSIADGREYRKDDHTFKTSIIEMPDELKPLDESVPGDKGLAHRVANGFQAAIQSGRDEAFELQTDDGEIVKVNFSTNKYVLHSFLQWSEAYKLARERMVNAVPELLEDVRRGNKPKSQTVEGIPGYGFRVTTRRVN